MSLTLAAHDSLQHLLMCRLQQSIVLILARRSHHLKPITASVSSCVECSIDLCSSWIDCNIRNMTLFVGYYINKTHL